MFDFDMENIPLQWNSGYNIGISVIDEEHQNLMSGIIRVNEALLQDNIDNESIASILRDLRSIAYEHFVTEEKLMKDAHYPKLKDHAKLHSTLLAKLDNIISDISQSDLVEIKEELSDYLKSWLVFHILGADQGYVEDVKKIVYP